MGIQSQRLRLAFISHRFQRNDGQGRVNYEIVRAALNQGYQVTVLATHCAEEIANHPLARHVHVGQEWLPTELLRNLAFAWSSARWIRRHRHEFDLVQANGFVTWEDCDVVAAHFVHGAWRKSPYYPFRSMSPYSLYQRLYTFLNSRWEKRAFGGAGCVIAVSKLVAQELKCLGVQPEKINVIYNGVDTHQFKPGDSERASFALPPDVPVALFVGDIRTPRKNLDTVLRALCHVPQLSLAVAGKVQGSPYPAMARDLGLNGRVFFLDKVSQIAALMRSVDLFVFPSRYEPFGLVALEAIASGVPAIVSEISGAADMLVNSVEILKDPNDADALAQIMMELLQAPDRRKAMAYAGRQRALELGWPAMAAAYLQIYEKLLWAKMGSTLEREAEPSRAT